MKCLPEIYGDANAVIVDVHRVTRKYMEQTHMDLETCSAVHIEDLCNKADEYDIRQLALAALNIVYRITNLQDIPGLDIAPCATVVSDVTGPCVKLNGKMPKIGSELYAL